MNPSLPRGNSAPRLLYALDEVAAMLGCSKRTVRREYQRGHLPQPVRMASRLMMPADELHAAIERMKRERRP